MKKLITFCLASLWLLCSLGLSAQNQGIDFYLYSSDRVRSLENNLQYLFHPFARTTFSISGHSNLENRLNFNQESKNAALNLNMSYGENKLRHSFSSDYASIFDASDLEPSPYVNKTATLGYALAYVPLDSLSIGIFSKGIFRREQDRYVANTHLSSDGFWVGSNARWGSSFGNSLTGLSGSAERKKLAWEAYDNAALNAYYSLFTNTLSLDSYANYGFHNEDIYILQAPPDSREASYYELSDTQSRSNLNLSGILSYNPFSSVELKVANDYYRKHTSYSTNTTRGNDDYFNQAQTSLLIQLHPRLSWDSEAAHSYAIKDYKTSLNTRNTETRHIGSRFIWEYADSDSLIALANLDLQIIEFPNDNNRWDNDLLTRSYKLGWKHYWHDRIRLGSWMGYSEREDVYIDSLLSANNRFITSYSLAPECRILIGDRISFNQSYQLRADYSDYIFSTDKENTFYRQLGYKLNLVFDSFPLISRSQDPRWLKLPFRNNPHSAFLVDMGYAYEENQYANEKSGYYELYAKNRRWTASLSIRHDIKAFYWSLTPKYSWGTWQEYNLLFAWAWEFNNASLIEFSLSPYGESLDAIDWRSAVSLNLRF